MVRKACKTIVGSIDPEVLAFTIGKDRTLDLALAEADCIGTVAHVAMLARIKLTRPLFTASGQRRVAAELVAIMRDARRGAFTIRESDQDVHLAVERLLTERLGDAGKRVHTGRSRNDQVAVDLRLYGKEQMLGAVDETAALAEALLRFARRHQRLPMVGRTHMQPAMPSSVGLWASAFGEGLLDDLILVRAAYAYNDRCPLGSAAGYGVPLAIDRALTARLLGFACPQHNVLHASNARGKTESVILAALAQVMLTLSRLAEDMILYSTPEFGYFALPSEYCTGSSIMPQKRNPDVLELVRAKAARVLGHAFSAAVVVKALPGGYNRDLQETKEPFIEGLQTTRTCLRIIRLLVERLDVNRRALSAGFTPDVFAADRALAMVAAGVPFRDAYRQVKEQLADLETPNPAAAAQRKSHLGAPGGLDFGLLEGRCRDARKFVRREQNHYYAVVSKLLGVEYPTLKSR